LCHAKTTLSRVIIFIACVQLCTIIITCKPLASLLLTAPQFVSPQRVTYRLASHVDVIFYRSHCSFPALGLCRSCFCSYAVAKFPVHDIVTFELLAYPYHLRFPLIIYSTEQDWQMCTRPSNIRVPGSYQPHLFICTQKLLWYAWDPVCQYIYQGPVAFEVPQLMNTTGSYTRRISCTTRSQIPRSCILPCYILTNADRSVSLHYARAHSLSIRRAAYLYPASAAVFEQ
jgi:hypothetical protein